MAKKDKIILKREIKNEGVVAFIISLTENNGKYYLVQDYMKGEFRHRLGTSLARAKQDYHQSIKDAYSLIRNK